MANDGIVNIHGKDYMTVAKRVELWLADNKGTGDPFSIETEVLNHAPVVVKAIVKYKNRIFTGISSVDLQSGKMIEKSNPYEVAETSAVGRALGFAGYGLIEGIASADEMVKSGVAQPQGEVRVPVTPQGEELACEVCGQPAAERKGTSKAGKPYHGIFCSTEDKSHTKWLS